MTARFTVCLLLIFYLAHVQAYMGIEQDINQQHFRNEQHKATVNILFTGGWISEKMRAILQEEDITPQQFNILRILRGAKGPLSTLQIRQRMLDKMSDTSRIVDRLLAKQLVIKNTCTHDKRLIDVSISAQGQKLLQQIDLRQHEMDAILKNLSAEEAKTLSELLDKIRR